MEDKPENSENRPQSAHSRRKKKAAASTKKSVDVTKKSQVLSERPLSDGQKNSQTKRNGSQPKRDSGSRSTKTATVDTGHSKPLLPTTNAADCTKNMKRTNRKEIPAPCLPMSSQTEVQTEKPAQTEPKVSTRFGRPISKHSLGYAINTINHHLKLSPEESDRNMACLKRTMAAVVTSGKAEQVLAGPSKPTNPRASPVKTPWKLPPRSLRLNSASPQDSLFAEGKPMLARNPECLESNISSAAPPDKSPVDEVEKKREGPVVQPIEYYKNLVHDTQQPVGSAGHLSTEKPANHDNGEFSGGQGYLKPECKPSDVWKDEECMDEEKLASQYANALAGTKEANCDINGLMAHCQLIDDVESQVRIKNAKNASERPVCSDIFALERFDNKLEMMEYAKKKSKCDKKEARPNILPSDNNLQQWEVPELLPNNVGNDTGDGCSPIHSDISPILSGSNIDGFIIRKNDPQGTSTPYVSPRFNFGAANSNVQGAPLTAEQDYVSGPLLASLSHSEQAEAVRDFLKKKLLKQMTDQERPTPTAVSGDAPVVWPTPQYRYPELPPIPFEQVNPSVPHNYVPPNPSLPPYQLTQKSTSPTNTRHLPQLVHPRVFRGPSPPLPSPPKVEHTPGDNPRTRQRHNPVPETASFRQLHPHTPVPETASSRQQRPHNHAAHCSDPNCPHEPQVTRSTPSPNLQYVSVHPASNPSQLRGRSRGRASESVRGGASESARAPNGRIQSSRVSSSQMYYQGVDNEEYGSNSQRHYQRTECRTPMNVGPRDTPTQSFPSAINGGFVQQPHSHLEPGEIYGYRNVGMYVLSNAQGLNHMYGSADNGVYIQVPPPNSLTPSQMYDTGNRGYQQRVSQNSTPRAMYESANVARMYHGANNGCHVLPTMANPQIAYRSPGYLRQLNEDDENFAYPNFPTPPPAYSEAIPPFMSYPCNRYIPDDHESEMEE